MSKQINWRWAAVLLAAGSLGGCYTSQMRISPDYGVAVKQDVTAQISDPDARYVGTPQPGYSGERAGLAQRRYATDRVIQPAATGVASSSSGDSGGGGGGGGGGGNGGNAGGQ